MQHPSEKFIKIEWLTLLLAVVSCLIAVIKSVFIGYIIAGYLIAISLFCHGVAAFYLQDRGDMIKQLVRSCLLLVIISYCLLKY